MVLLAKVGQGAVEAANDLPAGGDRNMCFVITGLLLSMPIVWAIDELVEIFDLTRAK
jgi:hypothetical protein